MCEVRSRKGIDLMRKYRNRRKQKLNIPALILISIILLLFFGLLYFLQVNIFPLIPLNGIVPNLFVVYILIIGLFGNNFLAILFGIITRNVYRFNLWRSRWNNARNALPNRLCRYLV